MHQPTPEVQPDDSVVAILIPRDLGVPVQRITLPVPGNEKLRELLGGTFTAVPWEDDPDVMGYVRTDDQGLPINRRAAALCEAHLREDGYIAGDFVLAGLDPVTRDHVDLRDELLKTLCPVALRVDIAIGHPAMASAFHAAAALQDIATKILEQGPGDGRAVIDETPVAVWEFS